MLAKVLRFVMPLMGVLLLAAIACGRDQPPARPSPTVVPTPAPLISPVPSNQPTPAPKPSTPEVPTGPSGFFSLDDLRAAYADPFHDLGPTQIELCKITKCADEKPVNFPRIESAVLDKEGEVVSTFGASGEVLLIDRFVLTAQTATSSDPPIKILHSYPQLERKKLFPPEYPSLSNEEKVRLLSDSIVSSVFKKSVPKDFDSRSPKEQVEIILGLFEYEAQKKLIPDDFESLPLEDKLKTLHGVFPKKVIQDLFPPIIGSVTLEQRLEMFEIQYLVMSTPVGAILVFGQRPDGTPDYMVLSRSVAEEPDLALEIFERKPSPDHPFPPSFPFEIVDIKELKKGDLLTFSGNTFFAETRQYVPTQKPATVSSIRGEILRMQGPVSNGDQGAPVFSTICGKKMLVGIIIGSLGNVGKENEAFVVGIRKALEFFEKSTDVKVQVKERSNPCPKADPNLKNRLRKVLSDGLPDSSYDFAELNNATRDIHTWWIRPFENVIAQDEHHENKGAVSLANSVLIGKYVLVPASGLSLQPPPVTDKGEKTAPEGNHKYRILWGGTFDGVESEELQFEYVDFLDFDVGRRWAIFGRREDTKFPIPDGMPFLPGSSKILEVGDRLYNTGIANFSVVAPRVPYPFYLHQSMDPGTVIGFAPKDKDIFYFQSSFDHDDIGSAIFEIIDGTLYVVGFFFYPMTDWRTETLGSALTIESALNALKEVTCSTNLRSCLDLTESLYVKKPIIKDVETLYDRHQIISLLQKRELAFSSLLTDILKPDVNALSQYEGRIFIFAADKTGALMKEVRAVEGEVAFLSHEYAVTTAALFPQFLSQTASGLIPDTSDVTSNVLFANAEGTRVEVRIGVADEFFTTPEMFSLFRDIPLILETQKSISDQRFPAKITERGLEAFVTEISNLFARHDKDKLRDEVSRVALNPEALERFLARPDVREFFDEILQKTRILTASKDPNPNLMYDTLLILRIQKGTANPSFLPMIKERGLEAFVTEISNLFARYDKDKLRDEVSRVALNPEALERFLARPDVREFFDEILQKTRIRNESEMNNIVLRDTPLILEIQKGISTPIFLAKMEERGLEALVTELKNLFSRHDKDNLRDEVSRVALNPEALERFLARPDVREFFGDVIRKMQVLDVVIIDRKNGFALLKRSTPPLQAQSSKKALCVVGLEKIEADQDILISHSEYIVHDPRLSRLKRVSPGTIAYATASSPMFVVNGFATVENLGSPIFTQFGEETCLLGIVAQPYPFAPDKNQTEGFGLSLKFILGKIKEKTGIDAYPSHATTKP